MGTLENWALREGVRQVQKQAGKATAWCDGVIGSAPEHTPLTDFDEADAEFWLRWVSELRMVGDAVVGIVDRLMGKGQDDEEMPMEQAKQWPIPPMHCDLSPTCDRPSGHVRGECAAQMPRGNWVPVP